MTASSPKVLIVCRKRARDVNFLPSDLERLSAMATVEWLHLEGGPQFESNEDPEAVRQLMQAIGDVAIPVIIVVLAFNFFGDGIRDAAGPYSQ